MPASEVFTAGSNALITGAASGIGYSIAKLCKANGMNVLLVDIKDDALKAAEQELAASGDSGSKIGTCTADVSKLEDWEKLKHAAEETLGTIEFLVLNAAVGLRGDWGDGQYFRKTLETNLFGVINGINTFLPIVQRAAKSKASSIVITGSKQGITNPPGNPAYNASKAAVKSLAEQLSFTLRNERTTVHLLVPGWTFTGLAGAGTFKEKPASAWTPDQVSEYLYQKMNEDKFYILCPDNDVTEELDKRRMLWSVGDIVEGRPPLSRWRDEWKEEAAKRIENTQI